jgi:hypothetical protein
MNTAALSPDIISKVVAEAVATALYRLLPAVAGPSTDPEIDAKADVMGDDTPVSLVRFVAPRWNMGYHGLRKLKLRDPKFPKTFYVGRSEFTTYAEVLRYEAHRRAAGTDPLAIDEPEPAPAAKPLKAKPTAPMKRIKAPRLSTARGR